MQPSQKECAIGVVCCKKKGCFCNLSVDVVLNVRFTMNGMCAKKKNLYIQYMARTSNNRVISSGDLYCCLLSQCEVSGFAIRAFPSQQYQPCHLTNSANWVCLMPNYSSNAFASDVKINIAMLNFGNAKNLCLFCHKRQNKLHGLTLADQDWIRPVLFQKFCRSGLDSD